MRFERSIYLAHLRVSITFITRGHTHHLVTFITFWPTGFVEV